MAAHDAPDRRNLLAPFRVDDGRGFSLSRFDTAARSGLSKADGTARASRATAALASLQALLYAEERRAVLVVLQAMDAGGKDGTIKHVMSGVNPQGITVRSFKQPGPVERAHDFLWRIHEAVPARGRIGIFNRSHYEDVLVTRVHPALLGDDRARATDGAFWAERCADIVGFERYLAHQGVTILKFFLHVSKAEQRRRLLARLDEPGKTWKFSAADLAERARWDEYRFAYEEAIRLTAHPDGPWFVVPADHKWHAHLVVSEAIVDALERLDPRVPVPSEEERRAADEARRRLKEEE